MAETLCETTATTLNLLLEPNHSHFPFGAKFLLLIVKCFVSNTPYFKVDKSVCVCNYTHNCIYALQLLNLALCVLVYLPLHVIQLQSYTLHTHMLNVVFMHLHPLCKTVHFSTHILDAVQMHFTVKTICTHHALIPFDIRKL